MADRIATFKTLARAGIVLVVALAGVALAGWFLGIPALTSIVPGRARLSVPTALGFFFCSASVLALTRSRNRSGFLDLLRVVAASLTLVAGLYALADFVASGGLVGAAASSNSGYLLGTALGRVAPATAFNFVIIALALLMPPGTRAGRIYGGLIAVALAVTGLDLVGYVYGVEALYRVLPFSAMALPTAISFALLCMSALLARPDAGWFASVAAEDSDGFAARRLLPAVLVLPVVLTGLMVLAHRSGAFDAPFGFAVLAVATSLVLGIITVGNAAQLAKHNVERHRSERLLRTIVENTPAVIYVKDLAGRYLMVNRRFCDIFHLAREQVIGRTDYDIFAKGAADAFRAMDERVARADRTFTEQEVAPHDDGPHNYISVKSPLREDSGQVFAVFGISTDITEHKRAEIALAASEERTRLIVDAALDAVVTIDAKGMIAGWSPQAEKTFGWTKREAIGRSVEEIIMPERYRQAHRQGLARYLSTGTATVLDKRVEMAALHRDGYEFPIELAITPIRTGDGIAFSAFVRDITDRKLGEAKLQTQVERLRLLDQITRAIGRRQDIQSVFGVVVRSLEERMPADFACVCYYDPARNALTVGHLGANSAALGRYLGMTERAEIQVDDNGLSRCVRGALVYESDIAEIDFPFPRRLAAQGLRSLVIAPLTVEKDVSGVVVVGRLTPNAFSSADCEFLKQLGEHVALAVHEARLRDSLQAAYDDLKQTQQAVMQQERLRALGQMASGIAHDINNAISPVAVYTKSLLEREPNLSPRTRDYLEVVGRVVKDVSATVARMRDFYRRDEADADLEPLDVNHLVPQVVELTRARWSDMPQQRGVVISVVTELEQDLPLIMGNAAELREAAINLIFNAVDALPEGGTITLRTASATGELRPDVRHVQFEVIDDGVGMDETARRRCLEPFFTTKGERGTGLGLAMVYGSAQRHRAALDIDSAPGKGTRVRLEFPASTEAPVVVEPSVNMSAPLLRLLLIDDDPAVLDSTRLVLELDGHTVATADGGAAGIAALRAARDAGEELDVVVTDLGMPYVDGEQVARAARDLHPSTIVVLLTGWGRKMGGRDESPVDVDYTLSKPLDLDELREIFIRCSRAKGQVAA